MVQDFFLRMARGDAGPAYAVVRGALIPVAGLFGWAVSFRNSLYDRNILTRQSAAVPVVSVGNLTVGGTGKTPTVAYVTRALAGLGRRPGILSRGYGGRAGDEGLSDENLQLCESLPGVPLLEDRDRVRGAIRLVAEESVDCIVLDDGFQHRRLSRDLDICLVDATTPVGSGWLLPAGLLLEHLEGLSRATVVLLTRCDLVSREALDALRERIASWTTANLQPTSATLSTDKVQLVGLQGRDRAYLWLFNPQAAWSEVVIEKRSPKPIDAVEVQLDSLAPGRYDVQWWDTREGKIIRREEITVTSAPVRLAAPKFARDVAVKVVPRDTTQD